MMDLTKLCHAVFSQIYFAIESRHETRFWI